MLVNKLAVFYFLRYQVLFAVELHGDKDMISTSHAVYFLFEHIIHAAVFMEILDKLKLFVNKKVEFFPAFTAADLQKESSGSVGC